MSEHEVPLEEVNEHIQHHAHESKEKWISGVALSTAFLAAFAAVAALLASHYENESMKEHAEAFDQYAYFQAKGVKLAILQAKMELLAASGKAENPDDKNDAKRYKDEQTDIKKEAESLKALSKKHGECHENFALGVTMFQMAIAIGAISVLTKRKGFWYVSLLLGAVGLYFLINGYRQVPQHEKADSHETAPAEEHGK